MKSVYRIIKSDNDCFLVSPIKEYKVVQGIEKSEAYVVGDIVGLNLLMRKEIVDTIGGLKFFDRMEKYEGAC